MLLLFQLEFTTLKAGWSNKNRNSSRNHAFFKSTASLTTRTAIGRKTGSYPFDPRTSFYASYRTLWEKKQHQVLQRQQQTSYELLSPPAEDDRILLLLLVFSRGEVTGCPLHQYRHCQERQLPSSALRHGTAPSCLPRAPKTHCQLIAGYSTSSRKASPPLNAELQLTKGSSHHFLQCELKLGTHIHH